MSDALKLHLESWDRQGNIDEFRAQTEHLLQEHDYYKANPNPALVIESTVYDLRPPVVAGLVLEALKKHSPSEVYEKIGITFVLDVIEVEVFAFVENVTTDYEIDLGGNVTALPETAVYNEHFKDAIVRAKNEVRRNGLILRSTIREQAIAECSSAPGHPVAVQKQNHPGKEAIKTALRLMTLDGPSAPQPRVWTFQSVQDLGILPISEGFSTDYRQRLSDGMPKQITDKPRHLLEKYRSLNSKHLTRLNAAIDRLNLGISETSPSDKIVEAAVALEAILSDDERQELTYRLRLRSALLLEKNYEQRKSVKDTVRKLYDERSKVLHTGLPGKADAELAMEGLKLAARLVERIIEIGKIPDWDTIELTDGEMSRATGG